MKFSLRNISLLALPFVTLFGCKSAPTEEVETLPNILWISAEDLSPRMAAYGDSTINTPNLNRLANEGIVYDHAYTAAGVCSPSRNAIITGRFQTSNGGHNMRTMRIGEYKRLNLPKGYNSVPPPEVKLFPEYLRAKGYYTTNNLKTDYQFTAPPTVWDEVSKTADWRGKAEGQPFFSVINFTTTHESQIWKRADHEMRVDPQTVPLPPYYPDNDIVRTDVARHYSNMSELDDQIGEVLARLEEDGLLENTIIFFWGDHGDGLPFYKRSVYRRGLHIPFIARFPNMENAGTRNNAFISGIDFGPTMLSLAGIETPSQMQGKAFLGKFESDIGHEYIFGARDRIDNDYDRVRSVMDRKFQYVKNFNPELPLYMDVAYRKQIPMMKMLLKMRDEGTLSPEQSIWFKKTKPKEELYNWITDPYQLNNLAENPAYVQDLERLRTVMENWTIETKDLGYINERELLAQMWNGRSEPPVTSNPKISNASGEISITCETLGASIAYRKVGTMRWEVYTGPIKTEKKAFETMAMRIGYEPSEVVPF
ncbi:MAG: N-sulfoglucosamine sulfohydrolase [Psychromonas sp.]|jgi:N-sulfoglucosamine sulfohydrolase